MMFEQLSRILLGSDVVELRLVDICCGDWALIPSLFTLRVKLSQVSPQSLFHSSPFDSRRVFSR